MDAPQSVGQLIPAAFNRLTGLGGLRETSALPGSFVTSVALSRHGMVHRLTFIAAGRGLSLNRGPHHDAVGNERSWTMVNLKMIESRQLCLWMMMLMKFLGECAEEDEDNHSKDASLWYCNDPVTGYFSRTLIYFFKLSGPLALTP